MQYLIEQFAWEENYYHLVNSKIFESDKYIPETSYNKNNSYFKLTKLDDEVQTKRTTSRKRGNV